MRRHNVWNKYNWSSGWSGEGEHGISSPTLPPAMAAPVVICGTSRALLSTVWRQLILVQSGELSRDELGTKLVQQYWKSREKSFCRQGDRSKYHEEAWRSHARCSLKGCHDKSGTQRKLFQKWLKGNMRVGQQLRDYFTDPGMSCEDLNFLMFILFTR